MAEMNPGQTWECEQKLRCLLVCLTIALRLRVLLHRQDDDDKRLY